MEKILQRNFTNSNAIVSTSASLAQSTLGEYYWMKSEDTRAHTQWINDARKQTYKRMRKKEGEKIKLICGNVCFYCGAKKT